uniref:Chemosensory protein n=1 Tax=Histia rhodope TaxID=1453155 RepID=A0A6M9BLX1_9NEOP|nr:chemosensory protein [Histia rhodope]
MKTIILVGWLCLLSLSRADYTGKFEDFDLDKVTSNREEMMKLINCFIGTETCTQLYGDLKKVIKEQIDDDCVNCSQKQLTLFVKGIKYFKQNEPAYWKLMQEKMDPEGRMVRFY